MRGRIGAGLRRWLGIDDIQQRLNAAERRCDDLLARMTALAEGVDAVTDGMAKKLEAAGDLGRQLDARLETLSETARLGQESLAPIQAAIEDLRAGLDRLKAAPSPDERLGDMEGRLSSLTAGLDGLRGAVAQLDATALPAGWPEALDGRLGSLEADVSGQKAGLADLRKDAERLFAAFPQPAALEGRLAGLQAALGELEHRLAAQHSFATAVRRRLAAHDRALADSDLRIGAFEQDVTITRQLAVEAHALTGLDGKLDNALGEIADLGLRMERSEQFAVSVRQELAAAGQADALADGLAELRARLSTVDLALGGLGERLERLLGDSARSQSRAEAMESRLAAVENAAASQEARLPGLGARIDRLAAGTGDADERARQALAEIAELRGHLAALDTSVAQFGRVLAPRVSAVD